MRDSLCSLYLRALRSNACVRFVLSVANSVREVGKSEGAPRQQYILCLEMNYQGCC